MRSFTAWMVPYASEPNRITTMPATTSPRPFRSAAPRRGAGPTETVATSATRIGVPTYQSSPVLLVGKERYDINRYTRFRYIEAVVRRQLTTLREYRRQGLSTSQIHAQFLTDAKKRYRFDQHQQPDNDNARLIEELGLVDYLADRFAIVGPVEDCVAKIEAAAEAGATHFWMSVHFADKERFMREWSATVMAMFRR